MAQNIYFLLCIIMKHKTQDYKITAVKYYLQNDDSLDDVCNILIVRRLLWEDGLWNTRK